mgnify:CR=1 FL=1|jgi:hypothetical protein
MKNLDLAIINDGNGDISGASYGFRRNLSKGARLEPVTAEQASALFLAMAVQADKWHVHNCDDEVNGTPAEPWELLLAAAKVAEYYEHRRVEDEAAEGSEA